MCYYPGHEFISTGYAAGDYNYLSHRPRRVDCLFKVPQIRKMGKTLKAYLDLTRAHFAPAWPTIFCAGLMLGFVNYGGFSWLLVIKAI